MTGVNDGCQRRACVKDEGKERGEITQPALQQAMVALS